MSRFKNEVTHLQAHIRTLRMGTGALFVLTLVLGVGWWNAPRDLTIHVPPDLRSGSVRKWWDVPPESIYAFAFYIFQQLNRWSENGAQDYGKAIFRVSPYLTPRYRADLIADMELKSRQGELSYRVRGVHEMTGHSFEERRVDVLAPGVWVVWLDLDLFESVKGMTVKKTAIRYPLRVVKLSVDPESNPWGLALDGFSGNGPHRLTEAQLGDEPRQEE